MPKFTVIVQSPTVMNTDLTPASCELEMEALAPIGAEIVEVPATTEEEFKNFARNEFAQNCPK